jgi:glycosyltransferase involved in cell wall biosynthesis
MKILFDHPNPFLLAHGGFQVQIEQTRLALEAAGIEVEWLRWWDATQRGDIIHFFGRPYPAYITLAHQRGMKVVISELLTSMGSRSASARFAQKTLIALCRALLPRDFTAKMSWDAYQKVDAATALTDWEKHLMVTMFDAPSDRVHVIPNGVEEVFFQRTPNQELRTPRSDYLVSTAAITERKRVVELAEAAVLAGTPLWIIGAPYSDSDPYYLRFLDVVRGSGGLLRYEGAIGDRAQMADIYSSARGFVLLSTMESMSLSALEAAAAGCPLLLSDLPWARSTFGDKAFYCPFPSSISTSARHLKSFHADAESLTFSFRPRTWSEVATLLHKTYSELLTS